MFFVVGVYSCTVKYKVNAGSVSYMKETKYTAKDANGEHFLEHMTDEEIANFLLNN